MSGFQESTLWSVSLGLQSGVDPTHLLRGRLREAFLRFRDRAATLAGEIPRDLPHFTVHDVTHLDSLWETASLIAGPGYSLTPTEGFVLGGAFLIHDLAMSVAAYPQGLDDLRREPMAQDMLTLLLKRKLGRLPSNAELETAGSDIQGQVTRELLRINHAKQAEQLVLARWGDLDTGGPYYLIEDSEIRETYGATIGRIAHSHWWSVDKLRSEFSEPLGSPGGYPQAWEVDPLKVAALLRVADASHLDDRRAPSFLRAVRRPEGVAKDHWRFQNNLLQPRLESDRLIYTSKRPCPFEDASSWWLCFETLQMVDRELRQVDSLLADMKRPRFCVRGVAKVERPDGLSELVKTDNWIPVDVSIKVSDVASLARNLGGEQLYGEDRTVPLRELIQNSSDAIRARRLMDGRSQDWGEIVVRIGEDADGHWVEVEDNGVGMSLSLLTGPLLDFGTTYWGSQLMLTELPGLLSKGFQPSGQFGIGFFSIFMMGQRIRVTTRRYDDALANTRVLEFSSGLDSRPILRPASVSEYLTDGGTRTRVWLNEVPDSRDGFLAVSGNVKQKWELDELCAWLCPSLDVDIFTEQAPFGRKKAVSSSDWITMDPFELLMRIWREQFYQAYSEINIGHVKAMANRLRLIKTHAGEILGRACIDELSSYHIESPASAITLDGLRANQVVGIAGILMGVTKSIARYAATPTIDPDELATWASNQALLATDDQDSFLLAERAALILYCGGNVGNLPIAFRVHNRRRTDAEWLSVDAEWLSVQAITKWQDVPDEVLLIRAHESFQHEGDLITTDDGFNIIDEQPRCQDSIIFIPDVKGQIWGMKSDLQGWPKEAPQADPGSEDYGHLLNRVVLEALAEAWMKPLEEVRRCSEFSVGKRFAFLRRGKMGRSMRGVVVDVIRKPKS